MRIAYVCADPGVPVFGSKGSSIHVQEILRTLIDRGDTVLLIAARLGGAPPAGLEHVEVRSLSRLPKGDAALRERTAILRNTELAGILESSGSLFDLIYERYSLWSFAAIDYALEHGIPSVLEVNSPLADEQARFRTLVHRSVAQAIAERVFQRATSVVAVSQEVADYIEQAHHGAKILVVANGVNPQRFAQSASIRSERTPSGSFTVGFVGSLKPWHGVSVLVEAFSLLAGDHPDARLLIVGDGPERERLDRLVAARGVTSRAQFTGAVPHEEIPNLLAQMDVAVAPYPATSGFYFSPLKLYEYMAAELPVVASGIGQIIDCIEHERSGLLCAPGDVRDLAAALDRLACDSELRQRLGRQARQAVLAERSWSAVVENILAHALAADEDHLATGARS